MDFRETLIIGVVGAVLALAGSFAQLAIQAVLRSQDDKAAFRREWHNDLVDLIAELDIVDLDLRPLCLVGRPGRDDVKAGQVSIAVRKTLLKPLHRVQIGHPDEAVREAATKVEHELWQTLGIAHETTVTLKAHPENLAINAAYREMQVTALATAIRALRARTHPEQKLTLGVTSDVTLTFRYWADINDDIWRTFEPV